MIEYIKEVIFTLENMNFYEWLLIFTAFLLGLIISPRPSNEDNDNKNNNQENEYEKSIKKTRNWFKDNIDNLLDEINWKNFKGDIKKIDPDHYTLTLTNDQSYNVIFDIFLDFGAHLILVTQIRKVKSGVSTPIDFDITTTDSFKVIKTLIQKVIDKYSL
ncbi:MAG: hypothetical protein ABGW69_02775 [Nanoarchaeota archaeon]